MFKFQPPRNIPLSQRHAKDTIFPGACVDFVPKGSPLSLIALQTRRSGQNSDVQDKILLLLLKICYNGKK